MISGQVWLVVKLALDEMVSRMRDGTARNMPSRAIGYSVHSVSLQLLSSPIPSNRETMEFEILAYPHQETAKLDKLEIWSAFVQENRDYRKASFRA